MIARTGAPTGIIGTSFSFFALQSEIHALRDGAVVP